MWVSSLRQYLKRSDDKSWQIHLMEYIEYELIRSKRKTLSIQVKPNGDVVVRAPLRLAKKHIDEFVIEKADWIEKTVKNARARNEQRTDKNPFTQAELDRLKRQARVEIRNLVWEYAPVIGVGYGRISIRAQKSRWGSCSREGNLNFNCLLMLAPDPVRRYVVVHELCHRLEMNHSPRFWAHVEAVIPDYREQRKWLRSEGSDLIARLE